MAPSLIVESERLSDAPPFVNFLPSSLRRSVSPSRQRLRFDFTALAFTIVRSVSCVFREFRPSASVNSLV
jgi:hypothetical protein